MGLAKIIYNVDRHPDWRYRIMNDYPAVCTVNADFAEEFPDLITRWMKVLVQAATWAKEHYSEVMEIMPNAVRVSEEAFLKSYPADFHKRLVPEISNKGMEALEIQKEFLLEYGFIKHDVDVKAWVDRSFLDRALRELEKEKS